MNTQSPKDKPTTPAAGGTATKRIKAMFAYLKRQWLWITMILLGSLLAFFIGICLLPTPRYKTGFRTLSELQAHAATLDEWIKMENDNELLPSYEHYYEKTFTRTMWYRWKEKCVWLLSHLRIMRQPPFSSSFFQTILDNVLQARLKKDWTGDIVQKFEVKPTSKIIVFGIIQGALHSLTRDLEQLKKLDIIDENFKLKNNDYYMVFLGNVVNRSPYTLDTFAVVLRLLEQNPDNIIYLRGTNEFFDYWKDHTLKRELELRCNHLSREPIPLRSSVDKFFNTLPITLYATMPSWSTEQYLNYVRISAFIGDKRLLGILDEATYAQFLLTSTQAPLDTFDLNKRSTESQPESVKLLLRAVVIDILKREFFEPMNGLQLLPPIDGVIAWNVISAPTGPYRTAFHFSHDAFVIIIPDYKNLTDWKIILYNRDVKHRERNTFSTKSNLFFR